MKTKHTQTFKKLTTESLIEKSVISAQFIKVVDQLKRDGHFEFEEDFCESYGYTKKMLNHVRKGRQDVSLELLYDTVLEWRVNPNFIFGLSDNMFIQQSHL